MRKNVQRFSSIDALLLSQNATLITSYSSSTRPLFPILLSPLFRTSSSASTATATTTTLSQISKINNNEEKKEEEHLDSSSGCLIQEKALEPDPTLYAKLLNNCTKFKKLLEGRIVHAHLLRSQFTRYLVIQNTILNMYAKCGSMDDARKVFNEMPDRDMVTWTALITGYSQNDRPHDALALFPQMLQFGLEPNQFTFSSLLKAAGAVPSEMEGRLVSKNDVSYNALIAGHARMDEGEHAVRLFCKMQREDFRPTHFTYSSVFTVCASIGALEQGKGIHAHMMKLGEQLIAFVGNTLLDMYAKSGSIEDAKKVFDRLLKRDVVSWNSMLNACAQHGLGKETVERFEQMLRVGIEPNAITFLCVLTACSHAGLLDKGQYYFELMKKYKVEPEVSHYVTIVDMLGRAGQFDRAERFINNMPIEPNAAVWGALLGSCRMHKNLELGPYAAERVFELDPHDSGPHVLLYNIYASGGRWSDAAKVRKMMKENGVKKEPACSWVEIENAVHVFVANDDAHPQKEEICKKWEEICVKIKEIGYVPDTSHVLLFVDEQERETKLQYHSEKLALAFSLLKTPPGSNIRIKKNIRVCGDCHSAFKFVSKVVQREITLRDTNRFHHFRDGSCSCGDYW
ncbi:hypothetical protein Vadar_013844 [Vaccinium darrowii]|uniref:Uncharacterized protein n=1 Tax=Vaccinium darrowii TaxID=229202 RepID=A0ACB7X0L5_9ERIC|nr:hypothetical protein Vadar_013844 [Vaccinium darrowii]